MNLKEIVVDKFIKIGLNPSDFKFRLINKSIYQRNRYKVSECTTEMWIWDKTRNTKNKSGYLIIEEMTQKGCEEFLNEYIEMIFEEHNILKDIK